MQRGEARRKIARTLNAAYADGLLSRETFTIRIEYLLRRRVLDPPALIGDLRFRGHRGRMPSLAELRSSVDAWRAARRGRRELLLALDWSGQERELLIGRHYACDVVLSDPSVSRRHARVTFRDGGWILQDLESTNGTTVNGTAVGRCELRPGDRLVLGAERLRVD